MGKIALSGIGDQTLQNHRTLMVEGVKEHTLVSPLFLLCKFVKYVKI